MKEEGQVKIRNGSRPMIFHDNVPTNENVADLFTKMLAWIKHKRFTRENGLIPA